VKDAELENLLESADATAPIARLLEDLPTRVRRRAKRRLRAKIVTIAVLVAPLLSLPTYIGQLKTPWNAEHEAVVVTTDGLKAQIAALDVEARFHLRVAQEISRLDSAGKVAPAIVQSLPLETALAADRFSAAAVLLQSADGVESGGNGNPNAVTLYQNVIRLFPDAPAATTARQRLLAWDKS
jgi:hypothetical protein